MLGLFFCIQHHIDMHIKMHSLLNLRLKLHTLSTARSVPRRNRLGTITVSCCFDCHSKLKGTCTMVGWVVVSIILWPYSKGALKGKNYCLWYRWKKKKSMMRDLYMATGVHACVSLNSYAPVLLNGASTEWDTAAVTEGEPWKLNEEWLRVAKCRRKDDRG